MRAGDLKAAKMLDPRASSMQDEAEIAQSRPYNMRVSLNFNADDNDDGADDLGGAMGVEEEELSREKVKRASNQVLQAVEKRKRKAKKKADELGEGRGAGGGGKGTDD